MNPQTIPAQVPGFDIEEEIYASSHTRILRGYRQLDRLPVIVKILQATDPTQVQLVQFDNEAEFTRDLDIPGVRKALGTARLESLHALALEYVPGRTLRLSFVEQRRGLGEFLDIAIQLAGILGELHNRHIIHRDINPNNIIVDESSTPRAHLIDFGIASRLSLRLSNLGNPDHLEGSLPYISPEQTGRMNRAVDYRTDLYSLGVTLYEMLAGNLPFEAHDAMEWVHAHMARTPAALGPGVPPALAGIIAKLLAKNAEDRYQSAFGLKYDLEQVHAGLNDFALARRDYSGRFLLPQKLYGRARETAALLEAFDRAAAGRNGAELLLVTGSAGVGKSALVYETHKPITAARGHFIQGKFDQFQRNVPYVALVQAFDGFVRLLMTNSDIELRSWREKLQEAAGNIGKVLTDLVPSLELLIGAQPDVPVLDGSAAQNRFHYAFKNLVRSMASPEHPLVLFIDDWQWADLPSINMLETLLSDKDIRNLLVIAAYRDNEVDAGHPLTAAIENIQREGAPVQRITLQNLSTADVHALAGDALKGQDEDPDGLSDLARLVYEKTGGNAFFVGQFLKTLYEEKCLTFDFTLLAWQWDMDHIRTRGLTDNVVDLLSRQVLKLPPETRKVLQFAACIGNHFTPAHVSVIAEQEMEEANQALAPAVMEGLLVPNHIHFQNMTGQGLEYQFVHDRVQQAAYALIPEDEKQELHLQIGRLMLVKAEIHHGEINETYEQLFEIVNSLNKGANLITDSAERLILARLNLTAGNRAKTSTAYAPALAYYQAGMSLLPEEGWEREYDLTLALHRAAAEAAFLSGDFAKTDELTDTALIQARTILDKVPLYDVQIQAQNARNNPLRGIEIGLSTLRALGISLPMKPSKIRIGAALLKTKFLLRNRSFEELLELPMMTRPAAIAAMRLLSLISATVYTRAPDLLPLTSLTMVSLAVRYGQSPQSPYLYAGYGMISGSVLGEIDRGYQFGILAMRLIERAEFQISKANAIFMFNFFVRHWNEHIHESIEPLLRGYHLGLECGNLEFAAWCALTHPVMMFCCGEPLTRVGDQAVKCLQMLSRIRQEQQQESLRLFLQMVLNWRENAGNPSALCGSAFDENERVPVYLERNNLEGLSDIYLYKTILGYWFHDYRKALEYSRQMESYLEAMLGSHFIALYYFYDALIRLALYPTASPVERWRWRIRISRDKGKFKKWAKHAPMNYLHKYELIEAEWCRVSGRNDRAGECYDRAVSLARENRFLNDEVLACELTGRFYLERGRMELAEHYLKRAHRTCRKWGADTKAAQMENLYSGQLYRQTASDDAASSATGDSRETASPSLDLASILKASQSLSSEIVTERLLVKLLHVVLENAGAETGYILLPHGDAWHLEVEGQAGKNGIHNHARPLADTDRVSLAIINYVLHTGEPVVLNDASREGPFSGDRHVTAAGTRSLLCLPLLSQGKPSGILYLVNNLTAGAFTPDRIEVLRVLASQAVISLENAQLYGTLEQKVAERTSDLARTNQQLAEARDLAEEATRAKSDFLARMSHEIRTPMNAIIGLSHLAMQTELSAKQEDYITKIQASSQNLLGIINDILDFSKIEAGKLSLESIPFKLDDVVENTCNQLALKASEKGLELLFSIAPETPLRLKGDPLRLGQILLNLSSNAVKFTDRGEVVITVSTPEKDTPAPLLRFEVRDTGIGLTNDQKTRLFLAFSQGDSSTTRRFGGTGLGLAICQRLVDMMGGEIGVDSVPGRGSAFWFTARLGLADSLPSEERILPAGLNNLKVLVVDDSETARSFLTEMLERFDFSVTSAGSGEEALQLLKPPSFAGKRRFDLILLDWNMPGIDGLETGRRVKEALGSDAPKLIMVSAYGRDEIFRRSQELGFDGFLMKPVGASVLFDTIMEAFGSPARKRHGGNRAALLRPEGFDAVRGATILMAEDNELNRQVATELLEQEGFWLTSVENGRMAVDLLRSGGGKSFDLVLMDLQMPEMDGFAATQAIRELGIDKLPIVAMTADAMSGMAERCLAAGMNDFVTKPINPQEVFAALARWIPAGTRTPRPRADKPSAVAPVPRLSNIDTVEGLQRVGGNVVAYRKLLKGFVQNQGGACEAVRMALKQKDTKLAVRSAHTLKGVSGNIGAVCLHQAAAQLEAAIKDNAPSIDELTALCETILDSVVAEIKTMYSAPAEVKASDASTPLDLKAAMPLVEQLKLLLSDNDTQAQSLLEELKALAAGTDWTGPLNDIEAALELYDFDESLRLLERLSG